MSPELYREMARAQHVHWWHRARREILDRVIARLGLPAGARLLEIGAGTGANLAMLGRHGELCAMESDDFARQHACGASGVAVLPGRLPDAVPFADHSFDLVCLLDVLEHIDDDRAALRRVRDLLRPEGRVLLTVPAYQWLYGPHDRAHHHRRRYTAREVRRTAREAGFDVQRCGYFNTLLFPLVVARRIGQQAGEATDSGDAALPGALLNCLLHAAFSSERLLVPTLLFPFGTSVLAVLARGRS
jgi:SAM-dependent methyltransferase